MYIYLHLQHVCGVCLHPQYGGWFAIRGAMIFKNITAPQLEKKTPIDILPDNEGRIQLLNLLNYHWQDWRFRDVVPVQDKYSDLQKLYFGTAPKDRWDILDKIKKETDITSDKTGLEDKGHSGVE